MKKLKRTDNIESTATNKGLVSGGLTFKRESSCGLSRPNNAKPRTVGSKPFDRSIC
jgi:hypothetical protein